MSSKHHRIIHGFLTYFSLTVLLLTVSIASIHSTAPSMMFKLPTTHVKVSHSGIRSRHFTHAANFHSTLAGRSGAPAGLRLSPWRSYRATWYSYQGGVGDGTVTASGTHVREAWTIAVDPRVIPLGSIVQVRFPNGRTHIYQALDTGGAIRGQHIDIFDKSLSACIQNGVQHIELRVLAAGPRHS